MPEVTVEESVLELFANHATQTKRAGTDGTVHYQCSCGVTLVLNSDK